MKVRLAEAEDLKDILSIYASAREFMKESDNPNQWGDSYPKTETIKLDIELKQSYVVVDSFDVPKACFAIVKGNDPTYKKIIGEWPNDEAYVTIHRVAKTKEVKGILHIAVIEASKFSHNIRIDTHEDNLAMRKAVEKEGFSYCGIIYLERGEPRLAFAKNLEKEVI